MILLRVPNWLGDAIMSLPAVESVASSIGKENISIIVKEELKEIYSGFNCKIAAARWDIEPYRNAEKIILFTNSFSTAFNSWRAGIKERIGYNAHFRDLFLTTGIERLRNKHQIEEYLFLAETAGYKVTSRIPKLSERNSSAIQGEYSVIAPGAMYGSAKRWNKFNELAEKLSEQGKKVVLLGKRGEELTIKKNNGIIDMIGKTTLKDALDIIGFAQEVISNDSGIAHAASALGRKTIVIFGPTEPEKTAPRGAIVIRKNVECSPCNKRICQFYHHKCMDSINVEDVIKVIG